MLRPSLDRRESPDARDPRDTVAAPSDDLSPIAVAYQWASRIIVVALEMVLPGMAGLWLDKKLGTVVLFMLVGFGLGCTAAIVHLVQMTKTSSRRKTQDE